MTAQYEITKNDEFSGATIYVDGETYTVSSDSPTWDKIKAHLLNDVDDDETLLGLIIPAEAVSKGLIALSERVRYAGGTIYFDGDPIESAIADHLVRILEAPEGENGVNHYGPLVKFLEKVATNPSKKSRKHLYAYVQSHGITIAEDGDMIVYKGVSLEGTSIHAGYGIVDGVIFENAFLQNNVGSIVEIPRSMVDDDRTVHCSTGLHVGTFGYASSFGKQLLTTKVNPRDVVSVPNDYQNAKIRVSRYLVLEINAGEYTSPSFVAAEPDNDFTEEDTSAPVEDTAEAEAEDEVEVSDKEAKTNAKLAEFKATIPTIPADKLKRHRNKNVTSARRPLFDQAVAELGLTY